MIEIKNLSKTFPVKTGDVAALTGVSATIADGDIFGIIGMSGAGKSTLLRCLCLLEKPSEGQILLNGRDLAALSGADLRMARRQMGVVFQGYNLLMQKTVAENVAFPLKLDKYDKAAVDARVKELLELVGMGDRMNHQPSELSGGQKQRVAIARAMANDPAVLLADEPTGALDSATSRTVMDIFHRLHAEGMTIVLITHSQELAAECGRILTLRDGQFIAERKGAGRSAAV